jgi:hypothetical protein
MTDTGENLVNLELPRSIGSETKGTMLHSDRALNKALKRARSADRGFDIFPESPPFTRLRMLVVHARREGQHYWVDRDVLAGRLGKGLFYLGEEEVYGIADETIRMGFEVGVLKKVEGRTALSMRWGNRTSMEEELRRAWIDHRCGHELQRRLDGAVAELHERFEQERDRRPPLESFDARRPRRRHI